MGEKLKKNNKITYRTHTINIYIDIIYDTKIISKKRTYINKA